MKTSVIYHSADFDGIFCREIARKFLPKDTEFIGWDFGNEPLLNRLPDAGPIYILDLPVDRTLFGANFADIAGPLLKTILKRVIWIDHHKSSIESHAAIIVGYRIDGVAACRLTWQWFSSGINGLGCCDLPAKGDYIERRVSEPLAVRLAGEYDIWDKRDPRAEVFQFGLRSKELTSYDWSYLLNDIGEFVEGLLCNGRLLQRYQQQTDASVVKYRSFEFEWEGLKFLALNTPRCNSLTFTAALKPEHDALCGFFFNGTKWKVSLYGVPGKPDVDLSKIAVKHGGGGHKQACGFETKELPFLRASAPLRETSTPEPAA